MSTKERVIELLSATLDVPKIRVRERSRLREDLGADSLALLEVLMDVEEEFGLKVEETNLPEIRTVGDLARKIENMRMGR